MFLQEFHQKIVQEFYWGISPRILLELFQKNVLRIILGVSLRIPHGMSWENPLRQVSPLDSTRYFSVGVLSRISPKFSTGIWPQISLKISSEIHLEIDIHWEVAPGTPSDILEAFFRNISKDSFCIQRISSENSAGVSLEILPRIFSEIPFKNFPEIYSGIILEIFLELLTMILTEIAPSVPGVRVSFELTILLNNRTLNQLQLLQNKKMHLREIRFTGKCFFL